MATVRRESSCYRWTDLLETERCLIQFVEDKRQGREYDKIKVIKLGINGMTGECINIFRYEDEDAVNDMLKRYGAE